MTSKRQRPKEYKSRTFYQLLFNRKEPREGSGAASTHYRKIHFQFFDPPAFCTKKQEARGLHSMSAIFFQKLHSLHSKEKNSEDIKTERPSSFLCQIAEARGLHSLSALFLAKVHISQKKNQRRPSQDFTSRRTRIKSTTTRPLKLNHEMLRGLSMENSTGSL